ncbi:cytochrome c [bacterium BMS3Abin03]|nr:cytochrome c [bacterium BMS3Abin03]
MSKDFLKKKIEIVKENPGLIFWFLYPYVLAVILGIGLYYLANEGNIAQQKIPVNLVENTVVNDLEIKLPSTIPPADVFELSKPTAELIAKGKAIFKTTCSVCHGENGKGTGPGAAGMNPAPRNFTSHEGWKNGETISGIFSTLEDGILNSPMIAYDFLTPEEKFGLAHYIRSEFITNPSMDDEFDLQALDMLYNLSEGVSVPGQIPVKDAEALIVNENKNKTEKISIALEKIDNQTSSEANLLRKVTSDLKLAMSALVNSDKWKGSSDSFITFITGNVNQNGFNGSVFNLTSDQWSELYNYLNTLL